MNIAHEIKTNIKADHIDDFIDLDYEGRFLRRKKLLSNKGEEFLVELPEAYSLSENDSFLLDDGRVIGINLKPEPLLKITHSNLPRISWHIGNRHTPCQIGTNFLLIREDHVLEVMLEKLGAQTEKLIAKFTPEGGAYGHARTHNHHHD